MIQRVNNYAGQTGTQRAVNHAAKEFQEVKNFGAEPQYELQAGTVLSTINVQTGESVGIYYDETSTEKNPVMLARVKKQDGSIREEKIEVNEVDPNNASYVEMLALSAHLKKEGKIDGPAGAFATMALRSRAKQVNESAGSFEKQDFLPAMQDLVSNALKDGQLETYLRYLKEMTIYSKWGK